MKVLITGSHGFIGQGVGHSAAREGHQILGIGLSAQPAARWAGDYIQADVANSDLSEIVRRFAPDAVFHAAGTASVAASMSNPLDDFRGAAMSWINTLEGIRRSGIRPVVLFPSSAAVYGNPEKLPVSEDAPLAPVSPYGFHKAACELLAKEYVDCFGLKIVVCRLFSVFGPAQRRLLVWELFKRAMEDDSAVWLEGTGDESRDYLSIDDVARAICGLAAREIKESGRGGQLIVNVASGQETKVMNVALQIKDLAAPEKIIRCGGIERPGDPRRWRADISLLRRLVPGWQPRAFSVELEDCIALWLSLYRSERVQ